MQKIEVSSSELEEKISEMQNMRSNWDTFVYKNKPDMIGGGMTPNTINQIADLYNILYNQVCELCDNTVQFLQNVNSSIKNADSMSADIFK